MRRDLGKFVAECVGPCSCVCMEEIVCKRRIEPNKDCFGEIFVYLCLYVYFYIFYVSALFSVFILRNT